MKKIYDLLDYNNISIISPRGFGVWLVLVRLGLVTLGFVKVG